LRGGEGGGGVGGKGGGGGRGEKWTKPCMHIWITKEKGKKVRPWIWHGLGFRSKLVCKAEMEMYFIPLMSWEERELGGLGWEEGEERVDSSEAEQVGLLPKRKPSWAFLGGLGMWPKWVSTCLANVRPWVQTLVPKRKKESFIGKG
jgi:hypothetical protein